MATTRGLLARIDAAPGRESELEKLLEGARSIVTAEPGTTAWFALRFGHGEFGIFDVFPDDAARDAHLGGGVVAALTEHGDLLDGNPQIEKVDVLADKLTSAEVHKGLLLRLPIKPEHADDAAGFLTSGLAIVADEPATTAWFALRFENGDYGVFDVFPDAKGRRAHLLGEIPRRLALHGLPWLRGLPDMSLADVMAQKL
jgi:quinol monooxygenase YgiN